MIVPSRHEDLSRTLSIIGGEIVEFVKTKPYNVESLFSLMQSRRNIGLDQYYNALLLLWLLGAIDLQHHQVFYLKN